jgi:VWFA-related protein
MRVMLLLALGLLALAALPAGAQSAEGVEYGVEIDKKARGDLRDGKRFVTIQFRVRRLRDSQLVTSVGKEEVLVEEDGQRVRELEVDLPRAKKLTTVLALDVSGSMARQNKMEEAKKAALLFLDRLDPRADVGLILFDHRILVAERPAGAADPAKLRQHRERLRQFIRNAKPQGGTAYLDATVEAVKMLKGVKGRRVVVLMTDGVDMSSTKTLPETIKAATVGEVPVYTLGIGEPGKNDKVTTVLVLDRSGSMAEKASDDDNKSKIDALQEAAERFVDLMARRHGARTTLLAFSDTIDKPEPFTRDRDDLRRRIAGLKANGGTLLYDATFAGVETLEAGGAEGKRAVVVLTDGVDEAPGSRRSDQAVIDRAKELKVPLYMLGLGRPQEINEKVMKRMAAETGGEYYYAGSQKKLIEVFENLSIDLHDDGIDEKSLRELAEQTGGTYRHVRKIEELRFIYEQLADELQSTYTVTYPSRRQRLDGTARGIDVKLVRDGKLISTVGTVDDVVRGVAVPQADAMVYLAFLALLGVLLAVPAGLRRLYRVYGGT